IPFIWPFIKKHSILLYFYILYLGILIQSIISEIYGSVLYLNTFITVLPISSLLILEKIVSFTILFYAAQKGWINYKRFNLLLYFTFLAALLFGFFQFFNFFSAAEISLQYYLQEGGVQMDNFLMLGRINGVSPAIITWSGCCVLMFLYFWRITENKLLALIGIVFCVLNIAMAASRSGIVALIGSIFIIQLLKSTIIDRSFLSVVKVLLVTIAIGLAIFSLMAYYLPDQIEFLYKRFDSAEDAMTTTGRGEQIQYFSNLLISNPINLIVGVGIGVINDYGYLEIDPAYIMTAFGLIGIILHYSLVVLILNRSYHFKRINSNIFLFVWGSTVAYMIFSIGFYFFYELYMGNIYWWLNGMLMGFLYNYRDRGTAPHIK